MSLKDTKLVFTFIRRSTAFFSLSVCRIEYFRPPELFVENEKEEEREMGVVKLKAERF